MTDRTFRERREKIEFREALREFAEFGISHPLSEVEEQYWQDVRNGMFDDDPIDDYEDLYYGGLDDQDDWEEDLRSVFDFDEPWDDLGDADTPTHTGNHVRNGDGRVWLVLDDGRWADILTGKTKRPPISFVPSEWIVF